MSAALVKELRERTGLGLLECKKALAAAGGDVEVAIEELRKSSGMKAAKKAGRTAADGVVSMRITADGTSGVIGEVNSETDFVARDENFLNFRFQNIEVQSLPINMPIHQLLILNFHFEVLRFLQHSLL